jgi:hypothetical protein
MSNEWRRVAASSRGGLGRIAAMVAVLACGLVLLLAAEARGDELLMPLDLELLGGTAWRAQSDFDVAWRNPSGYEVAGASWRVARPGTITDAQFVPGLGLAELDDLRVPAAGAWQLTVWLRDTSGREYPSQASRAKLLFDDVPPAVSFMPGDAEVVPPQLVAAVADPLSGVADGAISYRRLDREAWTALQTQIRAGALATELVATTPELAPGIAYLFRAEARDGAGNLGSTTLRADSTSMALQLPEASAAPSGGGGTAAAHPQRPTRLLAALASGRRGRTRLTVDYGDPVLLRGKLSSEDGGLAGRALRVVSRPVRGAHAGVAVESVTAAPDGRFELRLPPGPSRRIAVVFAGDEGQRPVRRRLEMAVRSEVSLRAAPQRLRTGGLLRLRGRVGSRGARVPRAGKLVTISYWERAARRWRPVIVTRSDRAGRFAAEYRFRYVTGVARIRLRATAPAEADWPYAPGSSRPLTVEVRG